MKTLSYWSKNNPIKARIIIGLCHILLIILGISFGIQTYLDDFLIPVGSLFIMVNVFFIAYMLYPKRGHKEGIFKYSFGRRVKHDFILVMASTWVLAAGVNNFAFQPIESQTAKVDVRLMVAKPGTENPIQAKELRKGFLKQIKAYRIDVKQQLKAMKADVENKKEKSTALKVLLIFLTLVLAFGLFAFIGALACEISCSGNEGLAIVVFIGGTIGIVWLTIFLISKILKQGKSRKVSYKDKESESIHSRV